MSILSAKYVSAWRRGVKCVVAATCLLSQSVQADEVCSQFKWDVSHERALFQQKAMDVDGGVVEAAAPHLKPETLYQLSTQVQDRVHFSHAPGKKMITDGSYAGLARLKVEKSGHYRISISSPFWIDVVDGDQLLPTVDFGGSPGCDVPHKIVEFVLPADHDLVLQLSAGTAKDVKLSVTAIPTTP